MTRDDRLKRFEDLFLPHLDAARNLARWLSGGEQDAADVVQDAYLRAYRSFESFRGENARAWLLAIVRNTFYTLHAERRAQAGEVLDEERLGVLAFSCTASIVSIDPAAALERASERDAVRRFIDGLPVEFREVLVLREIEDMSYKEIASLMRIPIGTVMSRLARARALLADKLRAHVAREIG